MVRVRRPECHRTLVSHSRFSLIVYYSTAAQLYERSPESFSVKRKVFAFFAFCERNFYFLFCV